MSKNIWLSDAYAIVDKEIKGIIEQRETHERALEVYKSRVSTAVDALAQESEATIGPYMAGYIFGVFDSKLFSIQGFLCEFCWVVNGKTYALNGPSHRPLTSELDPHLLVDAPHGFFWKKERAEDPDRVWFMGRGHA